MSPNKHRNSGLFNHNLESVMTFGSGDLSCVDAAGDANYIERASVTVPTDITALAATPHMHLLGKEMLQNVSQCQVYQDIILEAQYILS